MRPKKKRWGLNFSYFCSVKTLCWFYRALRERTGYVLAGPLTRFVRAAFSARPPPCFPRLTTAAEAGFCTPHTHTHKPLATLCSSLCSTGFTSKKKGTGGQTGYVATTRGEITALFTLDRTTVCFFLRRWVRYELGSAWSSAWAPV